MNVIHLSLSAISSKKVPEKGSKTALIEFSKKIRLLRQKLLQSSPHCQPSLAGRCLNPNAPSSLSLKALTSEIRPLTFARAGS